MGEYTTCPQGMMHNWDEGVCGVDEALCRHDGKCFRLVKVRAGALHFNLSNMHFVANGFVFPRLRRTIM